MNLNEISQLQNEHISKTPYLQHDVSHIVLTNVQYCNHFLSYFTHGSGIPNLNSLGYSRISLDALGSFYVI